MLLSRVTLSEVRNYASLELFPKPGINVFIGRNAQGKSNLLEAIAMLGMGKSFRTSRELELIREGAPGAALGAIAEVRAGAVKLSCALHVHGRGVRKIYGVNGRAVRYASYLGRVRVVTFTPDDLRLIGGPPVGRRTMMNAALAQESPAYYGALATYNRAVVQKGALLRNGDPDDALLSIYNERMITAGGAIIAARAHYLAALNTAAERVYGNIAGRNSERLAIRYLSNIPYETTAPPDIAGAFAARLRAARAPEIARRMCLVGPHRDDIDFALDDRSVSAFGSQGQRRSSVLAAKIAEYTVMRDRGGEAPLLLLDDVFSELDDRRQAAFLTELSGVEQVFVTGTEIPRNVAIEAAYRIEQGTLAAMPDAC